MSDQPPNFEKAPAPPPQVPQGPQGGYGAPPPGYGLPPNYGPPPYGYPPAYGPYGYRPAPAGPPHLKPSSNIGWAIAAIFLFWPLCIPSFIFANRVDDLWFRGDGAGAHKASHDARLYGMIGVIIGAVLIVGYFILVIVFVAFAADTVSHIQVPTYSPQPYPS